MFFTLNDKQIVSRFALGPPLRMIEQLALAQHFAHFVEVFMLKRVEVNLICAAMSGILIINTAGTIQQKERVSF